MSITLKEIITIEEYLGVFPQDSAVEEDLIQSAINRAIMTLDGICGGMIAKVWDITDTTDTLYRTEEEHGYIKRAHILQAQYNISRNLDMSAGTESYSSGSNNYNETRPRADLVADEVIYQLLAQARVYNPNITTDTTIAGTNLSANSFYDPSYDPSQEYVTVALGDNRYILKNTNNTNKFLHTDDNGNVDYVEIKASPTGTSSATANFITINGVEWAIGGAGGGYWGSIQGTITDQTDLVEYITTRLAGYATEQWVEDKHYLTQHQSLAEYAKKSELPTKTSDLTNDSGFITNGVGDLINYYTKSETYTQSEVDAKIATGTGLYLGWLQNDAEQLPSESEIGTWIINNWSSLQPSVVAQVTNNDYIFIYFSTQYIYWRVKAVTEATGKVSPSEVTWRKDLEFDNDITALIAQVEQNKTNIANEITRATARENAIEAEIPTDSEELIFTLEDETTRTINVVVK